MRECKLLEGSSASKFQLDLHTDYHLRIYDVIHAVPPAKLHLEQSDIDLWDAGIKEESDLNREVRASKTTEDLVKKDEERDQIITSLFQDIRNAAQSPLPDRREAGRTLKLIVDVYKGLQNERWAGKTVHTKGLVDDLAKTENAAAVTELGQTELVTLLRKTNDEFNALRESRTSKSLDTILPTSAKIRAKNDKILFGIFRHIEAAYLFADTDEDLKLLSDLIDQINVRTRESKATHNKSQAQKKAAASKKDPGTPKKPRKPKTSDEPDIHLPEEDEPKKPEGGEGKKPEEGGGTSPSGSSESGRAGDAEIHMPEE